MKLRSILTLKIPNKHNVKYFLIYGDTINTNKINLTNLIETKNA